jgi:hypothetical protein
MKVLHCAAAVMMAVVTTAVLAQPARLVRESADAGATEAVLAVRERVRSAVAARDRGILESLYAEEFMHLRDSGRVDLKGDRIALLLAGESTIETAPEQSVDVRALGPTTAIATGISMIRDPQARKNVPFRWLSVYVKQADGWRIAVSQASRVRGGGR